jgi:tetratricopeptide (TPR) repeat protein
MRIIIATLWLLIPLGFAAYHFGPGKEHLTLDHTEDILTEARQAVADEDWTNAVELYQKALAKLPKDRTYDSRRIQLEIAKAKMQSCGLPEAREDLAELVSELNEDPNASSELKEDALSTLANSRYYMTYLMKLEGLPASEWEPEIEAARQEYKLLAQTTSNKEKHLNDLEAAIRLARAEPTELYGLPIPSQ